MSWNEFIFCILLYDFTLETESECVEKKKQDKMSRSLNKEGYEILLCEPFQ